MKVLNLTQGSAEWHAARAQHFCASDAPAMMGASKYKSRTELIRENATGLTEEINGFTQSLYDKGHAAEASIRPHIEKLIGDDLYPTTATNGRLLASFDGVTMDDATIFEHKLWNEELAARVRAFADGLGEIDPHYYWQLEHQLAVNKNARRVIFVVSDGTPEKCVTCFYERVPGRRDKLLAGWAQFEEDVANYDPARAKVETVVEQKALMALPALSVQLVGKVTGSNLALYKETALDFIRSINTDLKTDQDFADAEATVKFCDKAEKELKLVKEQALAQTATIDELFRTIDQLAEEMRQKRLTLDKLVKGEKDKRRTEIVSAGHAAYTAHIAAINKSLKVVSMPSVPFDPAGAMKGKKTLTGCQEAVDDELARFKIAANELERRISGNLLLLAEHGEGMTELFRDLQSICTKEPEDFTLLVQARVDQHKAKEAQRIEAERARIRAEEEARAQREAEARAEKERQRIREEEQAKAKREQEAAWEAQRAADHERRKHLEESRPARELNAPPPKAPETPAAVAVFDEAPKRPPVAAARQGATRPSDDEIITALSAHYRVHEVKVIEWLLSMDLQAATKRVTADFN